MSDLTTLKIRNIMYERKHLYAHSMYIPEFHYLTGKIIPNDKWTGPDELTIEVGGYIPVRVVKKDKIVEGYAVAKVTTNVAKAKTWTVKGSKNNTYTVNYNSGRYECTCPGFQFRRVCKHVNEIKLAA